MTVNLRGDQCCTALVDQKRCTKPATELGGLCRSHWAALSPQSRALLKWEAAWTAPPVPKVQVPKPGEPATSQERFAVYYEQREVIKLYADLARFEMGA